MNIIIFNALKNYLRIVLESWFFLIIKEFYSVILNLFHIIRHSLGGIYRGIQKEPSTHNLNIDYVYVLTKSHAKLVAYHFTRLIFYGWFFFVILFKNYFQFIFIISSYMLDNKWRGIHKS